MNILGVRIGVYHTVLNLRVGGFYSMVDFFHNGMGFQKCQLVVNSYFSVHINPVAEDSGTYVIDVDDSGDCGNGIDIGIDSVCVSTVIGHTFDAVIDNLQTCVGNDDANYKAGYGVQYGITHAGT